MPCWVTVNVCPPTVIVPMRCVAPVFAATVKPTEPFPLPDAPLVTVIQETLLAAVQAQPVPAVTESVALSPAAGDVRLTGEIEVEQEVVPCCVTVNVCPAAVIVPVRPTPLVFGATVKPTTLVPVPEAPRVIVIQSTLLADVQAQPPPVTTDSVAFSPAAGDVRLVGVIE